MECFGVLAFWGGDILFATEAGGQVAGLVELADRWGGYILVATEAGGLSRRQLRCLCRPGARQPLSVVQPE
ncbi:MAG TPA: hypothetical protein PLX59_07705 [Candidatus Cloacimonadota bacterium]|nr:hypothetical protein [Candidatus Cloacimonadota bacterium]